MNDVKELNEDEKALYNKALRLLKNKDYTTKEMIDKLMQEEDVYYPMVLDLVAHLSKINLIDDDLYARLYVGKAYGSNLGINGVARELKKKGIDQVIIENYIDEYSIEDEFSNAWRIVEIKYNINTNKSTLDFKRNMKMKLSEKGFTWETIDKVMNEVDKLENDDKDDQILEKEMIKTYRQYSRRYAKSEIYEKMIRRFLQKGFRFSDIKEKYEEILKGEDEDEDI